ncbi:hypothetical protein Micbo1qcDRAFT_203917 [Microdochium bolleyi]|uniref:LysM domain-containing protein n=1 Tax=Microdochium bolleyi TaxID=196109 RepID=A0A136J3Y6_9PEZI|nr:hypothetical protein Micbo1qcDRAFT_203917 [Microdochium bolleyi]
MRYSLATVLLASSAVYAAAIVEPRDCRRITVRSGDSCSSLASTCGVSGSAFLGFNGGSGLCSRLVPGQSVCCSAGKRSVAAEDDIVARAAECRTTKVQSGDSCGTLAARCGVSGADFTGFNSATPNLCSTLLPGQSVCCSSGTLPQPARPQPGADGVCATYDVKAGDYCARIADVAASGAISVADIERFNKDKTWLWKGCNYLLVGQRICLSDGKAPLPAAEESAICGPTVPGTEYPKNGQALKDLNPCPDSQCCSQWGQCGTTEEHCSF